MTLSTTVSTDISQCPDGRDVLVRLHPYTGDSTAPVAPVIAEGVTGVKAGPWQPGTTASIFPPGGLLPVTVGFDHEYCGELEILTACAADFIRHITGRDWSAEGPAALPAFGCEVPLGILELVYRDRSHCNHIISQILPDICLLDPVLAVNTGAGKTVLKFTGRAMPFTLTSGTEMVLDRFTGDGLTTSFSLSAAPVRLLPENDALPDNWPTPYLVRVLIRGSDNVANPVTDGLVLNGNILQFSSAPAQNCEITIVYAKLTA